MGEQNGKKLGLENNKVFVNPLGVKRPKVSPRYPRDTLTLGWKQLRFPSLMLLLLPQAED